MPLRAVDAGELEDPAEPILHKPARSYPRGQKPMPRVTMQAFMSTIGKAVSSMLDSQTTKMALVAQN